MANKNRPRVSLPRGLSKPHEIFGDQNISQLNQDLIDRNVQMIYSKVATEGYPFESYSINTDDGYILTLHRIPFSPTTKAWPNKPAVLLQHGMFCSSHDWIIQGPGKSLAYILADHGFDVWMGNTRGNTFSKQHKKHKRHTKEFWDFSWHEMGVYDLPAFIDYIILHTQQKRIHYIGHCQGTTAFFVMASMCPEYNSKIQSMHALAPIAYMTSTKNPFFQLMTPAIMKDNIRKNLFGTREFFLPSNKIMRLSGSVKCCESVTYPDVCRNILFLIGGYSHENMDSNLIPEILKTTPAGGSVGQIWHYAQCFQSNVFRPLDMGRIKNWIKYRQTRPSDYQIEKIFAAPIYLYWSHNDWLTSYEDTLILLSHLSNVVYSKAISSPSGAFNHLDFIYGINANELVYRELIENLNKYKLSMLAADEEI